MSSVSKTILIGNLGGDPEIRVTPGGKTIATLSVATSRSWKNKDTNQKESETEWHRVIYFDRLAEVCRDYLKKGSKVYVEGFNKTKKYQDKGGIDRWSTDVIGREMQMLDSKGDKAPQHSTAGAPPSNQPQGQHQASSGGDLDEWGDDIPFM